MCGYGSERVVGRQRQGTCALVPGVSWGLLPGLVLINAMHWGSRVPAFLPQESEELLPSLAKLLAKMRCLPSHICQPIINSFPHFLLIMAHQPELQMGMKSTGEAPG